MSDTRKLPCLSRLDGIRCGLPEDHAGMHRRLGLQWSDEPAAAPPEGVTLSEESQDLITEVIGATWRFATTDDRETPVHVRQRDADDARTALESRVLTLESENAQKTKMIGVMEERHNATLFAWHREVATLRVENAALSARVEELTADRDRLMDAIGVSYDAEGGSYWVLGKLAAHECSTLEEAATLSRTNPYYHPRRPDDTETSGAVSHRT